MSIKKINTNLILLKEITIEAILESPKQIDDKDEEYRREIRLFRDILRFIISIDKRKDDEKELTEFCEIEGIHFKELFKPRTLCNWLLHNNVDLRDEFSGQPYTMSERAHKIGTRISTRLEKLIELGVLSIDDEEIESERNREITYRYHVESNGFLIASMLNLQNFGNSSKEYKRILEFILNRILEIIPLPYKTSGNYYFYFLNELLHNCIGNHQDILHYFFDLILQHPYGILINFSVLRNRINSRIYTKIIEDAEFRSLFYKSMYEFKTHFWLTEARDKVIKYSWIKQERIEAIQLVKMQFKLDVESQIDKDILEVLKTDTNIIKSYQYRIEQNGKGVSEREVFDEGKFMQICAGPVLDFDVRNAWEKVRYNNLSNVDHITLIVKCSNVKCNKIYPYPFEVEKELFGKISCRFCKKNILRYYDINTELDSMFIASKKN